MSLVVDGSTAILSVRALFLALLDLIFSSLVCAVRLWVLIAMLMCCVCLMCLRTTGVVYIRAIRERQGGEVNSSSYIEMGAACPVT